MGVSISFDKKPSRIRNKGKSTIAFPESYVLIDIETTGLSADYDSILEIAAIKVTNKNVVSEFQTFVAYDDEIPDFITELTGITNQMLVGAPEPQEAIKAFYEFIGNEMIVGYNVNFDINFLYDYVQKYLNLELKNDFVDCLRISRKLFPDEKHHRLIDMINLFEISVDTQHRALDDCYSTNQVFDCLKEKANSEYDSFESFAKTFKSHNTNAKDISTNKTEFDTTNPIYGKLCVFTGALEKYTRKEAMQIVVDLGGEVGNSVTAKTNFLILGNNDYCSTIKNGKSSKQLKAEELILKGKDISILPENTFYDMLSE